MLGLVARIVALILGALFLGVLAYDAGYQRARLLGSIRDDSKETIEDQADDNGYTLARNKRRAKL